MIGVPERNLPETQILVGNIQMKMEAKYNYFGTFGIPLCKWVFFK